MSKQRRVVRSGNRSHIGGMANQHNASSPKSNIKEEDLIHMTEEENSRITEIPVTFQAITDFYEQIAKKTSGVINAGLLRKTTISRIEEITGRPLICYVTKIHNVRPPVPAYIDDSDLMGFADLIQPLQSPNVDVLIISNGGSAEASERIVHLLRDRFQNVRFIVPGNAFSAATLICFSGDEILMDTLSTLGPIDPQLSGIPARAILRAFETLEQRFITEGPRILTAYAPLIEKYDLHLLEICKSAEELSKELAHDWLSTYMLKGKDDSLIQSIVRFFSDYDTHKSHGRSIDRKKALSLGLNVINLEGTKQLSDLVRSLYNQYMFFFEKTAFYKLYENGSNINWGRQFPIVNDPESSGGPSPAPSGLPKRSDH